MHLMALETLKFEFPLHSNLFKHVLTSILLLLQVAFLASALGPRVAAACAHASLSSLSNQSGNEGSPGGMINFNSKGIAELFLTF